MGKVLLVQGLRFRGPAGGPRHQAGALYASGKLVHSLRETNRPPDQHHLYKGSDSMCVT
jgi:hypothetical protein